MREEGPELVWMWWWREECCLLLRIRLQLCIPNSSLVVSRIKMSAIEIPKSVMDAKSQRLHLDTLCTPNFSASFPLAFITHSYRDINDAKSSNEVHNFHLIRFYCNLCILLPDIPVPNITASFRLITSGEEAIFVPRYVWSNKISRALFNVTILRDSTAW